MEAELQETTPTGSVFSVRGRQEDERIVSRDQRSSGWPTFHLGPGKTWTLQSARSFSRRWRRLSSLDPVAGVYHF